MSGDFLWTLYLKPGGSLSKADVWVTSPGHCGGLLLVLCVRCLIDCSGMNWFVPLPARWGYVIPTGDCCLEAPSGGR